MSNFYREQVASVHHWTNRLFSFKTSRNQAMRFSSGHFVMMGLEIEGRPLLRAYSIASATYENTLEFLSIAVEDGPLTSRLRNIQPGNEVVVGRKPTGTLLIDHLLPGGRLYLLATGTGLAPYLSIVRDPETYQRFEQIVLIHGVREIKDLAYHDYLTQDLPRDELLGELVSRQLVYHPMVTREPFRNPGRITAFLRDPERLAASGLSPLDPARDRVMLCGGPAMLADLKAILDEEKFVEGSSSRPGSFVLERAFVEK